MYLFFRFVRKKEKKRHEFSHACLFFVSLRKHHPPIICITYPQHHGSHPSAWVLSLYHCCSNFALERNKEGFLNVVCSLFEASLFLSFFLSFSLSLTRWVVVFVFHDVIFLHYVMDIIPLLQRWYTMYAHLLLSLRVLSHYGCAQTTL